MIVGIISFIGGFATALLMVRGTFKRATKGLKYDW